MTVSNYSATILKYIELKPGLECFIVISITNYIITTNTRASRCQKDTKLTLLRESPITHRTIFRTIRRYYKEERTRMY